MRDLMFFTLLCVPSSYLYVSLLHSFRISFHTLQDGSSSASFHIPWTKTTKELNASVILTAWDASFAL